MILIPKPAPPAPTLKELLLRRLDALRDDFRLPQITRMTDKAIILKEWVLTLFGLRYNGEMGVIPIRHAETHNQHMAEYIQDMAKEMEPQMIGPQPDFIITLLKTWDGFKKASKPTLARAAVQLLNIVSAAVALYKCKSIPEKLLHVSSLVTTLAMFISSALQIKQNIWQSKASEDSFLDTVVATFNAALDKIVLCATDSFSTILEKIQKVSDKCASWFTTDPSRYEWKDDMPLSFQPQPFEFSETAPEISYFNVEDYEGPSVPSQPKFPSMKGKMEDILKSVKREKPAEKTYAARNIVADIDDYYSEILRLDPTGESVQTLDPEYNALNEDENATDGDWASLRIKYRDMLAQKKEALRSDIAAAKNSADPIPLSPEDQALLDTAFEDEMTRLRNEVDELQQKIQDDVQVVEQEQQGLKIEHGIQGFAFVVINIIVICLYKKGTRIGDISGFLNLFKNIRGFINETKSITKDIVEAIFQIEHSTEKYVISMYEALITLGNALNRADVRAYASNPEMYYHLRTFEKQVLHVSKLAVECGLEKKMGSFQGMLSVVNKSIRDKHEHIARAQATTGTRVPTRIFHWWSPGGLGKSTIVAKVFDAVGKHFGWSSTSYNVTLDNEKYFKEYNGQRFGLADEFMKTPCDPLFGYIHEMSSPNFQNLAGALPAAKNQPNAMRAVFLFSNSETSDLTSFYNKASCEALWSRIESYRFRKDAVEQHLVNNPGDRFNLKHMHDPDGADIVLERTIKENGQMKVIKMTLQQFIGHVITELTATAASHQVDDEVKRLQDDISQSFIRYQELVASTTTKFMQPQSGHYAPQPVLHIYGPSGTGKTKFVTQDILPRLYASFPHHCKVIVSSVQQMKQLTKLQTQKPTIYFVDDPQDYITYMDLYNTAHRRSIFVVASNLKQVRIQRRGPSRVYDITGKVKNYWRMPDEVSHIGLVRRLAYHGACKVRGNNVVDVPTGRNMLVSLRDMGSFSLDNEVTQTGHKQVVKAVTGWISSVKNSEVATTISQSTYVILKEKKEKVDLNIEVDTFEELALILSTKMQVLKACGKQLSFSTTLQHAFAGIPDLAGLGRTVQNMTEANFTEAVQTIAEYLWAYNSALIGRVVVKERRIAALCKASNIQVCTPVETAPFKIDEAAQTVTFTETEYVVPVDTVRAMIISQDATTPEAVEVQHHQGELMQEMSFERVVMKSAREQIMLNVAADIARTKVKVDSFFKRNKLVLQVLGGISLIGVLGLIISKLIPKESKPKPTPVIDLETQSVRMTAEEYKEYLRQKRYAKTRADFDDDWRAHTKGFSQMLKNYPHRELTTTQQMNTARLAYNNLVRCVSDSGSLYGLMLAGNVGVTNAHILPEGQIGDTFQIKSDVKTTIGTFDARAFRIVPERDLLFFTVGGTFQPARDIRSHILPAGDVMRTNTAALLRPDSDTYHLLSCGVRFYQHMAISWKNELNPLNTNVFLTSGITSASLGTARGDCGLPYISTTAGNFKIMGLHSAGNQSETTMTALTTEDLNFMSDTKEVIQVAQSEITLDMKLRGTSNLTIEGVKHRVLYEEREFLEKECDFDAPSAMELTSVSQFAVSKRVFSAPMKPTRYPTHFTERLQIDNSCLPASENLKDVDTTGWPKARSPQGKTAPCQMAVQIEQFKVKSTSLDVKILDQAVAEVSNYYKGIYGTNLKELTEFEMFNGFKKTDKNYPGALAAIDTSAAAGFMMNVAFKKDHKGDVLSRADDYSLGWDSSKTSQRVQQRMSIMEDCLLAGEKVLTIYKDSKKSELLPTEKVKAGNVRLFQVCSFEEFLLCRKYFGTFAAQTHMKNDVLHAQVGTDQATVFHKLALRFLKIGRNGEDGDFKKFDKTIPAPLVRAAIKCINSVCDKKTNVVRTTLGEMLINSIHMCYNTLYMKHQGNPSGNFITTILNCVVNDVMAHYLYIKIMKAPLDPTKVDWVSNGDDVTTIIHDSISNRYNFETRRKVIEEDFGMAYTHADKQSEGKKVKDLAEMSFVSRRFTLFGDTWTGAVKPMTMQKLLHWSSNPSDNDQIASQLDTVLCEAGSHGPEVGEQYVKQVGIACLTNNVLLYKLRNVVDYQVLHKVALNKHNATNVAPIMDFNNLPDYLNCCAFALTIKEEKITIAEGSSVEEIATMNSTQKLYELCAKMKMSSPEINSMRIDGTPDHAPEFEVRCVVGITTTYGKGKSVGAAKLVATQKMLDIWHGKTPESMRKIKAIPPRKGTLECIVDSGLLSVICFFRTVDGKGKVIEEFPMVRGVDKERVIERATEVYNLAQIAHNTPILVASNNGNMYDSLSNFGKRPFWYKKKSYDTVEHAYQTLKAPHRYAEFARMSPAQVKKAVRGLPPPPNQEQVLYDLNMASFYSNPKAKALLLETGDSPIHHNIADAVHGVPGGNLCGRILMRCREACRNSVIAESQILSTIIEGEEGQMPQMVAAGTFNTGGTVSRTAYGQSFAGDVARAGTAQTFLDVIFDRWFPMPTPSVIITGMDTVGTLIVQVRPTMSSLPRPAKAWIAMHQNWAGSADLRFKLWSQSNLGGALRVFLSKNSDATTFTLEETCHYWYEDITFNGSGEVIYHFPYQSRANAYSLKSDTAEMYPFTVNVMVLSQLKSALPSETAVPTAQLNIDMKLGDDFDVSDIDWSVVSAIGGASSSSPGVVTSKWSSYVGKKMKDIFRTKNLRLVLDGINSLPIVKATEDLPNEDTWSMNPKHPNFVFSMAPCLYSAALYEPQSNSQVEAYLETATANIRYAMSAQGGKGIIFPFTAYPGRGLSRDKSGSSQIRWDRIVDFTAAYVNANPAYDAVRGIFTCSGLYSTSDAVNVPFSWNGEFVTYYTATGLFRHIYAMTNVPVDVTGQPINAYSLASLNCAMEGTIESWHVTEAKRGTTSITLPAGSYGVAITTDVPSTCNSTVTQAVQSRHPVFAELLQETTDPLQFQIENQGTIIAYLRVSSDGMSINTNSQAAHMVFPDSIDDCILSNVTGSNAVTSVPLTNTTRWISLEQAPPALFDDFRVSVRQEPQAAVAGIMAGMSAMNSASGLGATAMNNKAEMKRQNARHAFMLKRMKLKAAYNMRVSGITARHGDRAYTPVAPDLGGSYEAPPQSRSREHAPPVTYDSPIKDKSQEARRVTSLKDTTEFPQSPSKYAKIAHPKTPSATVSDVATRTIAVDALKARAAAMKSRPWRAPEAAAARGAGMGNGKPYNPQDGLNSVPFLDVAPKMLEKGGNTKFINKQAWLKKPLAPAAANSQDVSPAAFGWDKGQTLEPNVENGVPNYDPAVLEIANRPRMRGQRTSPEEKDMVHAIMADQGTNGKLSAPAKPPRAAAAQGVYHAEYQEATPQSHEDEYAEVMAKIDSMLKDAGVPV